MSVSPIYAGPQCPHCSMPLDATSFHSGSNECVYCHRAFEGTAFQPRDRQHQAVLVVTETPDGTAAACANHAGNAAVTNCQRCGLFICALCDLNVGAGSYCPSCFDRARTEGALTTRYRNYATIAVSASVLGIFINLLGPFAIYYALKGMKQRQQEGVSRTGMVVALILGILETLAMIAFAILIIIALVSGSTE